MPHTSSTMLGSFNSSSGLRATAAEFVPSFGVASASILVSTSAPPAEAQHASSYTASEGVRQQEEDAANPTEGDYEANDAEEQYDSGYYEHNGWQQQCWQDSYEHHNQELPTGYYDDYGNWVPLVTSSTYVAACAAEDEEHRQQLGFVDTEGGPDWSSLEVTPAQALQLLRNWHPRQNARLLNHLYTSCNCDLQATLQILSEMEWEQVMLAGGSTSTPAKSTSPAAVAAAKKQQDFSLTEELFPELPGAKQAAAPAAAPAAGSWAKVASKPSAVPDAAASKPKQAAAKPVSSSKAAADAAVQWVETGDAVAQEYAAARAEARDHARVRNACFHEATRAFLAGNKALAKELSAKGKAAAQRMWEAHERASASIFAQRNPSLQASKPGAATSSIDLHGLHVREVQAVLPRQLRALAGQKQRTVSLIVGTGHHTKGAPGARVGPAVEQLLREMGYRFSQPQAGLLRVQL